MLSACWNVPVIWFALAKRKHTHKTWIMLDIMHTGQLRLCSISNGLSWRWWCHQLTAPQGGKLESHSQHCGAFWRKGTEYVTFPLIHYTWWMQYLYFFRTSFFLWDISVCFCFWHEVWRSVKTPTRWIYWMCSSRSSLPSLNWEASDSAANCWKMSGELNFNPNVVVFLIYMYLFANYF